MSQLPPREGQEQRKCLELPLPSQESLNHCFLALGSGAAMQGVFAGTTHVHAPCGSRSGVCALRHSGEKSPCADLDIQGSALLQRAKEAFEALDEEAFARIRGSCNPYEPIGNRGFVCRSAAKLANLDFLFGLLPRITADRVFLFADICACPGGFSEYALRKCAERRVPCKGWGISLLEQNEHDAGQPWRVAGIVDAGVCLRACENVPTRFQRLCKQSCEGATAEYTLCAGADGTGDLYQRKNIQHFVDEATRNGKDLVDLVVCDGGIDAARAQQSQEALMLKLILCEVLTMFQVLRTGGCFVVKSFETHLAATNALLGVLHDNFECFTIVKPVTSRPANSERYVVCQKLRPLSLCERQALVDTLDEWNTLCPILQADMQLPAHWNPLSPFICSGLLSYIERCSARLTCHQIHACASILRAADDVSIAVNQKLLKDIEQWESSIDPKLVQCQHEISNTVVLGVGKRDYAAIEDSLEFDSPCKARRVQSDADDTLREAPSLKYCSRERFLDCCCNKDLVTGNTLESLCQAWGI